MGDHKNFNLPPGFRFCPTDEDLIVHFLHRKAKTLPCHPDVIPDLDLYHYDPWDLDGKAMSEGKRWYFYSRRTKNNRITESGYWQNIGVDDEPIYSTSSGQKIGIKHFFTFYIGEPSQGVKTNWIMEEYGLSGSSSGLSRKRNSKDHSKWVVCRVYERNGVDDEDDDGKELSCLDEVFLSMDDLDDISLPNDHS